MAVKELSSENIKDIYPLSPMQEGMFFHWLYDDTSQAYFEQISYRFYADLDAAVVKRSLQELFKHYDILRTVFNRKKITRILQVVLKERAVDFYREDISQRKDKEEYSKRYKEEDRKKLFDLTKDVLMRVALLKFGEKEYEFIWSFHHILMDGWCLGILISRFREIYNGLITGRPPKLPPVKPYREYIQWLEKQDREKSRIYWRNYLEGYNEQVGIPSWEGHVSSANTGGYKLEKVALTLRESDTARLFQWQAKSQLTQNTIIQGVWGILLGKYNRKQDVVFGSVVSGRPGEIDGVDMMVGLFINTIPVRVRFHQDTTTSQLLQDLQQSALESEPHHYCPLVEIQAESQLKQNLMDHIMEFQSYPVAQQISGSRQAPPGSPGLALKVTHVDIFEQTHYPFNLRITPGDRLEISLEFNRYIYDPVLVEKIAANFLHLLSQIPDSEGLRVQSLGILSEEEKRQILDDFNNTAVEYPSEKTLHELFRQVAAKVPDYTAVVFEEEQITYRALDKASDALAAVLIEKGLTAAEVAAVMPHRSLEMIIGIMSVLKAGAAYLPIDPAFPKERINYMLADSSTKILLTTQDLSKEIKFEKEIVYLSDAINRVPTSHLLSLHPSHPFDPAYVIYTSGSTGKPKGVIIEHKNVVNFDKGITAGIAFYPGNVMLALTTISFDIFVLEIFLPLLNHLKIVIASEARQKDPVLLAEVIVKHCVNMLQVTPSTLQMLVNSDADLPGLKGVKELMVGGEAFPDHLFNRTKARFPGRIHNMYGPTETTVWSAVKELTNEDRVTIGTPLANTYIYMVDPMFHLQPIGAAGELCIGGDGVAKGYLNRPELTFEKFLTIKNRSYRSYKSYIYRTGDLARWLADGDIEFLGRLDHQVKIRGFRIELGEIESQLVNRVDIKEAVVVVKQDTAGDKYICAYIVASPGNSLDESVLREYLAGKLPGYMIPSYFVQLEQIPLTPNGKINRKALPAPDIKEGGAGTSPRNKVEEKLVEIWSEILGIEKKKLGIDHHFFQIGGHSLKAVILISSIHKEFNVKLSLAEFFKAPFIRWLAEYIKNAEINRFYSIEPTETREYYPLSSSQNRLFFLWQMEETSVAYNMSIVFQWLGPLDKARLDQTFRQLISRHESLRTSFPIKDNQPLQRIRKQVELEIEYYQVEVEAKVEEGEGTKGHAPLSIINSFIRPFDLARAPLLRAGLIRISENKYIFMTDMHHIVSDGISIQLLVQDFIRLYSGKELPPLRLQYKDYSQWQNSDRQKQAIKGQKGFWLRQFADEVPVLNLPLDYPRPAFQRFEGEILSFQLSVESTRALKQLALVSGATLNMMMLAIYNVFLGKISGQEDIVVGVSGAARRHADLERIIGMFINALAMRNYPEGNKKFVDFLMELKERTLEVYENQEYQFEDLVENISVKRDPSRNPVFDTMFTLQERETRASDISNLVIPGLKITPYGSDQQVHPGKFDLNLTGFEADEKLFFSFEYCTILFKEETIKRFIAYFKKIVSLIVKDPTVRLGRIEIISEQEKRQVLFDFNDTRAEYHYPEHKTIPGLFAEQAKRTPGKIALVSSRQLAVKNKEKTWEPVQITYRELNERSAQLAGLLRRKGIRPDNIVGIMVERSVEMIIGIMGILKSGAGYFPIDPQTPLKRIHAMLRDSGSSFLVTHGAVLKHRLFTMLQDYRQSTATSVVTVPRAQVTDLDGLPFPDRSLVDYEAYSRYIGQTMVKNSISMQATRGCPFSCAYCHKIWPKNHVSRSAENIFAEVQLYYNKGIRRFAFIDDIFNLNIKNSERFFRLIIENRLDVQLFFPNGVRGDILTKAYIDLMVEAGTVNMALALETASPRLQESIGKRLNLQKLYENIAYIWEKYPQVISELFTIHGFPSETKEEAEKTLDFIKRLKWVHFPYVFVLKIYPHTEMARIALENGIPEEAIAASEGLAYHELPETLPFDKSFTIEYQAKFLKEYFLSKERLLEVLPYQMNILTEDEMVQKYNSYLPTKITRLDDLLTLVGITRAEFAAHTAAGRSRALVMKPVPDLNRKLERYFKKKKKEYTENAFNILLLDMSQFFSSDSGDMLYEVMEPPLGLMYLATYLNRQMGDHVNCKAAKSRIDFDSFEQLKTLLEESKPDLIGIRTLTFFRDFFHRSVGLIRQWGFEVPIIAGGPYATSDYTRLLSDGNIDVAVLGEGEVTFCQLVEAIIVHKGQLPPRDILEKIPGIAFVPEEPGGTQRFATGIIQLDMLPKPPRKPTFETPVPAPRPGNLAYTIFTSGSTGKPKGVMVEHKSLLNLVFGMKERVFSGKDSLNLNVSLLSPYVFDASVKQVFPTLLSGHKLVVVPEDVRLNGKELVKFYNHQDIRVSDGTPAHLRILLDEGSLLDRNFPVEQFLIGGEELEQGTCKKLLEVIGGIGPRGCKREIINVYGPTEATDVTTLYHVPPPVKPTEGDDDRLAAPGMPIGKPLPYIHTCILDRFLNPQPVMIAGELHIGGRALARGYLNNPGLTAEKFILATKTQSHKEFYFSWCPGALVAKLYKTGDLCRWLPDGNIEFSGRIDNQIKLRGYRVEIGEIENQLLTHPGVKQAVILARTDQDGDNDKLLFAYVVPTEGRTPENTPAMVSELKKYLSQSLPAYMIPSFVIPIEKIPLTANGKVDRKTLFKSGITTRSAVKTPRNEIERKLLKVWSEVLGWGTSIGIDDNFFELGGHSLKAIILLSKVHKELHVEIPLAQVFITPHIRGMARYIKKSVKNRYASIEPVEKKDYYPLSSAQKRLYIMQQVDPSITAYNITNLRVVQGRLEKNRLEEAFQQLIKRHESLRTSFATIEEESVQEIHENVEFDIEYYSAPDDTEGTVEHTINRFIRPFDLEQAPLLRVGLIKTAKEKFILIVDMHHIITDGVSANVLIRDFALLHEGMRLPLLRLQYKDFSQWQNSDPVKKSMANQKKHWMNRFSGDIPQLDLPIDYPRPGRKTFDGDSIYFVIGKETNHRLGILIRETGATLFMVLLSVYNILLSRYSRQEDIVVGSPITGRRHADLQQIVGMFVNMLAFRNHPTGSKTFRAFLEEVKQNALLAYENQDYQFEQLIIDLDLQGASDRNPLFDVVFAMQKIDVDPGENIPGDFKGIEHLEFAPYPYKKRTTPFALLMSAYEMEDTIEFSLTYSTHLFMPSTAEKITQHYIEVLEQVAADSDIELQNIQLSHQMVELESEVTLEDEEGFGF